MQDVKWGLYNIRGVRFNKTKVYTREFHAAIASPMLSDMAGSIVEAKTAERKATELKSAKGGKI
jgi:hypothetical protein